MASHPGNRLVTVLMPEGLHARPASQLVKVASRFDSDIEIIKDGVRVDAKSILSVLTLSAVQGTELELAANGSDAGTALDAISELFEREFPESDTA